MSVMVRGVEIAEREGDAVWGTCVRASQPRYCLFLEYIKRRALEENTPANDNGDLTAFNPSEVTVMVSSRNGFPRR